MEPTDATCNNISNNNNTKKEDNVVVDTSNKTSDTISGNVTPVGSPIRAIRALQINEAVLSKDPFENEDDDLLYKKCKELADDTHIDNLIAIEAEKFKLETFWQEVDQKVMTDKGENNILKVNVDGIDLTHFKPRVSCRENVFAINLSNAGIEAIDSGHIEPNWFRSLTLVGSPLSNKFVTTNLCMLLYLDLSFSDISLDNFDTSDLSKLRFLNLEGCSLSTLAKRGDGDDNDNNNNNNNNNTHWLSNLINLETLNVADNEFEVSKEINLYFIPIYNLLYNMIY
jgi:hypothetical protein